MRECKMLIGFTIAMEMLTVVEIMVEGKVVLPGVGGVEAGCGRGEVGFVHQCE